MSIRRIVLQPQPWTLEMMEQLDQKGLIKLFKPSKQLLEFDEDNNMGETIYASDEQYGPHKLICAALNKSKVQLGVHPDNEEILLPDLNERTVKPCYYIVSYLSEREIRKGDREGTLSEEDFICLSMFPNPRGADMFTVLKGTVHCEVTPAAAGEMPYIFVTESRDLPLQWIDLEQTEITVG